MTTNIIDDVSLYGKLVHDYHWKFEIAMWKNHG